MKYYRPEMKLILSVPYFGKTAREDHQTKGQDRVDGIEVLVRKATLERNNHLEADTLSVDVEWMDAGVDPRWMKNAMAAFYMGDTYGGKELLTDDNLRFTGVLVNCRRTGNYDSGFSVSMNFHDYTTLFINTKPFPSAGIPHIDDTIITAWHRICDYTGWYDPATESVTSSVKLLRDNIAVLGILDVKFSNALPKRFTEFPGGQLQPKEGSSAWDVWQYAIGTLGLTSFIDRNSCIVLPSQQYYKKTDAPIAIWGKNVYEMDESINAHTSNKGIRLVSFDHSKGEIIESFYPPPGDPRIKVKRAHAKSKHYTPSEIQSAQYETLEYYLAQTQGQLDAIAEAAYNEWARQEIEGSFKTGEMWIESKTDSSQLLDLLSFRHGQSIFVEIDEEDKEKLKNQFKNPKDRINYLVDRGYSEKIAELIVGNLEAFDTLTSEFHINKIVASLDESKYECIVHFKNQINPKGYTEDPVDYGTYIELDEELEIPKIDFELDE